MIKYKIFGAINHLDMNANLGGFASAWIKNPVWVMNVVPVQVKVDTLGAIYERGLIGRYILVSSITIKIGFD